jgi:hypothetical protein
MAYVSKYENRKAFFYLNLIMQVKNEFLSRRIILFASILILALIIAMGFIFIRKKSTSSSNLISAIPVDASLVIQINEYHNFQNSLFEKNKIWSSLKTIPPFDRIEFTVHFLDSLAVNVPAFSNLLSSGTIYISGHFVGGRKSDFLYIIEQKTGQGLRQLVELIEKISGVEVGKTERKYEGKSIFTLSLNKTEEVNNYYISIIEGNILISKSVILIENAIRQYSLPKSLLNDPGFASVISTAGKNKDANVYIDMSKFTGILSGIAGAEFSRKVKAYENFTGWMELDLNTTEKLIMLNGFVHSEDLQNSFTDLFSDNSPVVISVDKILPASVSTFFSIGAEDLQKLYRQFDLYLQGINKADNRNGRLHEFEKKYGTKPEEVFLSFMDNEITVAHGNITDDPGNAPSNYVLIKCKSGAQTAKIMGALVEKCGSKTGRTFQQLSNVYSIDNDTKFSLVEFPAGDITGLLFGGMFSIGDKNYYTLLGNYLVFGNSRESLGEFLYFNVLSKTLSTNEAYKAFNSNLAQKSYFIAYTNLSRAASFFKTYLHENIIDSWENHFDLFQTLQPMGMQLTEVSNMKYANLVIQSLDEYNGKPQTIWESLLDTTFTSKPQLVENHYTKQKEIFLQDDGNTIYLINKAGRIIWRQKIAETINSKIYQVDYFKNGKLQLMFSSANYLHLLDRNGNYVERYPVRLRSESTAGMSLFDYENNRDYRIFIPCDDNKVYAYSIDGNLISGWQFQGSDYPVQEPVEHFRIGDMDYIVFGDKFGTYILDRRGNTRVSANNIFAKSNNTYYLDERGTPENSRLVTTDTAGNVVSISFTGTTSITSFGKFSGLHYFDFKDVNADGEKDYIYLDGNTLTVYTQNKSVIFNFSFPNAITNPPIYFSFSATDRKLGVVDSEEKKIYLINNTGQIYKGFPLDGSTLFSIGYLETTVGQFNLIVGGRNNFLYNYSVQ